MKNELNADWLKNSPIAHRGLQDIKNNIIENTLESIASAINKGYPVEIDIRLTKDNEIIIFHDKTLKRIAGIKKDISKYTLSDLKNLKLLNTDSKISSLKEVLELVDGKVPLLIELKVTVNFWRIKRLSKELSKILINYKGEYAIQSYYPKISKIYKKYDPNAKVGLLGPLLFPNKIFLNKLLFKYSVFRYKYDFIAYSINHVKNNKLFKKVIAKEIPLLFYHITNKNKEELAKIFNGNLIWADYEETGYLPKV